MHRTTTTQANDWTVHPVTGRANSSPLFFAMVKTAETTIRANGDKLVNDGVAALAHAIVSAVVHEHHLAPTDTRGE